MNKEDFSEIQLRELFNKAGLNSDLTERAIADYIRYRESELSSLDILDIRQIGAQSLCRIAKMRPSLSNFFAEALAEKFVNLKNGKEIVEKILRDYLRYLNYKKEIAETYQESKSWDKVITTVVYRDVKEAQESFIEYVEQTYQTKIKDAKHLQKLTGITEETLEGLEETLINARYSKYFRALEKTLQERGKYKDLLQIKPQDYGLPKTWSGGTDLYTSILWALSFAFMIGENSLIILPDLRSIAKEIEAPYSVLMDAYKISNN